MIEVISAGLETSVQELPGRIGYWMQGFPPSGPMDIWSFRLANLLVGNPAETAALECQFLGPTLRFDMPALVAVTVLAAAVNLIELVCTAGLPAVYTQILAAQDFGAGRYYAYLGLYDPEWEEGQAPHEIGRAKFGRISIANTDSEATALMNLAFDAAWRAVEEQTS